MTNKKEHLTQFPKVWYFKSINLACKHQVSPPWNGAVVGAGKAPNVGSSTSPSKMEEMKMHLFALTGPDRSSGTD